MDHSKFILQIEGSGLVIPGSSRCFTDRIIRRWLEENEWVENEAMPCRWCQHMENKGFSEEKCRQKVSEGGSCYRQTLRDYFVPFLRNALLGKYPADDEIRKVIHRNGSIWDGLGDETLVSIMLHELGSILMRMAV